MCGALTKVGASTSQEWRDCFLRVSQNRHWHIVQWKQNISIDLIIIWQCVTIIVVHC